MAEEERSANQQFVPSSSRASGRQLDGPFWLATLLSAGGVVFLLVGSVTMYLGGEEDPRRESIRSIWRSFSRHLPDLGPDALVRFGFWMLLILIVLLSVGLMLLASTVRDDPEPSADPPA